MGNKDRRLLGVALVVLVTAVLFYIQDRWYILNTDDFAFSTMSELVTDDAGNRFIIHDYPITSLGDVLKSQAACYMMYSGRYVCHGIIQWFCGTKSPGFYVVVNTVMWVVMFVGLLLMAFGRRRCTAANATLAFCVIWLLMPNALRMFTGAAASAINYLWTGGITFFFLLLFERIKDRNKPIAAWTVPLMVIYALFAGTMQESFSIGVSAGLCLYLILKRKEVSWVAWVLFAAYVLGTALNVFAPGNMVRSDNLGHIVRWQVIKDLLKVPVFDLFIITAAIALFIKPGVVIDLFKRNLIIVVAVIVNLLFAVFVAYTMAWQLSCISLFCAILLLQLYDRMVENKVVKTMLPIVAACATLAIYIPMHQYRHEMWDAQQAIMKEALTSSDGLISLKRATEIDNRYSQSRFSPILWIYIRNQLAPLVLNDQFVEPGMISNYLTRCRNPKLIKALLPDSAEAIAGAFAKETPMMISGNEAVYFEGYTIVRNDTEEACLLEGLIPCQSWQFKGKYYKLYFGNIHRE